MLKLQTSKRILGDQTILSKYVNLDQDSRSLKLEHVQDWYPLSAISNFHHPLFKLHGLALENELMAKNLICMGAKLQQCLACGYGEIVVNLAHEAVYEFVVLSDRQI